MKHSCLLCRKGQQPGAIPEAPPVFTCKDKYDSITSNPYHYPSSVLRLARMDFHPCGLGKVSSWWHTAYSSRLQVCNSGAEYSVKKFIGLPVAKKETGMGF